MGDTIARVAALGTRAPTPRLPHRTLPGKLVSEPAALIFKPNSGRYTPFPMPWDHLKQVGWGQADGDELSGLILFPITVVTLGLVSNTYTYVWIEFWDEPYDWQTAIFFKVGGMHDTRRAGDIVRRIATDHGRYRTDLKSQLTIYLR